MFLFFNFVCKIIWQLLSFVASIISDECSSCIDIIIIYYLFRECVSRCRFQPYDCCVIVRFVE